MSQRVDVNPGETQCIQICIKPAAKQIRKRNRSSSKTTKDKSKEVAKKSKTYEELKAESDEYEHMINNTLVDSTNISMKLEETYLTKFIPPTHPLMTNTMTMKTSGSKDNGSGPVTPTKLIEAMEDFTLTRTSTPKKNSTMRHESGCA